MKISFKRIAAALAFAAGVGMAGAASANTTSYWVQAGLERFYNGQFFGTALTQDGRVTLGFKMNEAMKSTEPYFWSLAYDGNGNLWAGSGNKAILYKLKKDGGQEEVGVLPGMGITALAVDSKNNVYAAVMPGGRIFRIDPRGEKKEFAMVPATYVWDMEFDGKGNLFCVTGVGAGAFEIKPDGKVIPLYNSSESHFLSMFLDGKGYLYTGTSPGGLVLKINIKEAESFTGAAPGAGRQKPEKTGGQDWMDPAGGAGGEIVGPETMILEEGAEEAPEEETGLDAGEGTESAPPAAVPDAPADPRVKVLLDLEEDEAYRLLLLPDGNFLVAANRNQMAPQNPQNPRAMIRNEPLSFPLGQAIVQQQPGKPPAIPARAYLVTPEGRRRLVLEIPDPYIMSMISLGGDDILVGTGNEGRIYTMNVKTDEATLQSLPVRNVLSLAGSGTDLRIGTGSPGAVYRPAGSRVEQGQYLSSINDASTTAFYGNLDAVADLPAGAALEFQTRTGNTPDPMDGTWSGWSEAASKWPAQVKSPPGRYIQYMATMKPSKEGNSPRLSEARIYYITDNQGPEITKLQVLPQPDQRPAPPQNQGMNKPQGPPSPPMPPQQSAPPPQGPPEKNLVVGAVAVSDEITFRWESSDPDSDILRFTLQFRKLPFTSWVEIAEKIYGQDYIWRTESLPDGIYEARLLVTDAESNPKERALNAEKVSEPFIIDHTRPAIKVDKTENIKDGGFRISAVVTDPTSIISSVEYSLNDLEWNQVFPKDSIFDSSTESVEFTLEKTGNEGNTVLIRARDFVGNTGSVSVPLMK